MKKLLNLPLKTNSKTIMKNRKAYKVMHLKEFKIGKEILGEMVTKENLQGVLKVILAYCVENEYDLVQIIPNGGLVILRQS